MPEPARLPPRDVDVDRLKTELLLKLLCRYMVVSRVFACNTAHRTHTLRVEAVQTPPQHLSEAPALAAKEPDGEHQPLIDCTFRSTRH